MMNIRKVEQRSGNLMDRIISCSNDTIDALNSMELRGDNKTIRVDHSGTGTVITAMPHAYSTSVDMVVDEAMQDEQELFGINPDMNGIHAYTYYQYNDDGYLVGKQTASDMAAWLAPGESARMSDNGIWDIQEINYVKFGFQNMKICINGLYSEIAGNVRNRTVSGATEARPTNIYGYTLDELAAQTLSSLQSAPSSYVTDSLFIKGCLQLRTELHCITGATSGELYDDFYYDPFYTEWKVTHEIKETTYGYDGGSLGYASEFATLNTLKRVDSTGLIYFQPLAYYLIYDCRDWVMDMLDHGSSTSNVKFKWRQVDFAPTLNISMSKQLREAIWDQTNGQ